MGLLTLLILLARAIPEGAPESEWEDSTVSYKAKSIGTGWLIMQL